MMYAILPSGFRYLSNVMEKIPYQPLLRKMRLQTITCTLTPFLCCAVAFAKYEIIEIICGIVVGLVLLDLAAMFVYRFIHRTKRMSEGSDFLFSNKELPDVAAAGTSIRQPCRPLEGFGSATLASVVGIDLSQLQSFMLAGDPSGVKVVPRIELGKILTRRASDVSLSGKPQQPLTWNPTGRITHRDVDCSGVKISAGLCSSLPTGSRRSHSEADVLQLLAAAGWEESGECSSCSFPDFGLAPPKPLTGQRRASRCLQLTNLCPYSIDSCSSRHSCKGGLPDGNSSRLSRFSSMRPSVSTSALAPFSVDTCRSEYSQRTLSSPLHCSSATLGRSKVMSSSLSKPYNPNPELDCDPAFALLTSLSLFQPEQMSAPLHTIDATLEHIPSTPQQMVPGSLDRIRSVLNDSVELSYFNNLGVSSFETDSANSRNPDTDNVKWLALQQASTHDADGQHTSTAAAINPRSRVTLGGVSLPHLPTTA